MPRALVLQAYEPRRESVSPALPVGAAPQALIAAREADPNAHAAEERRRAAARAARLDAALAVERSKRAHAARLVRALHGLEAGGAPNPLGPLATST
jgi:hypothetical protein